MRGFPWKFVPTTGDKAEIRSSADADIPTRWLGWFEFQVK